MAKDTTRRMLLKVAPLAALAPAVALGAPEDPILPIYREWQDARAGWRRLVDQDVKKESAPEVVALMAVQLAAFDRMVDMTPTSMAGIAALAQVMWSWTAIYAEGTEEREDEIRQTENLILAAIWRAASGETGRPAD